MKLIPLKRTSTDISISGKKNVGKTIVLSLIGKIYLIYFNAIVFSNYNPYYPHIYCENIIDAKKINKYPKNINKIFLGDDFEQWAFSRFSNKKENIALVHDIIINWGKNNCSIIHTEKREEAIDIGIINETEQFWKIQKILKYKGNTNNNQLNEYINYILSKYINFYKIEITRYDENINKLPSITIEKLEDIIELYDTQEEVKTIYK